MTTNATRLSQSSLEKGSRPASAGSSNDVTHTNGMEDYPYVPENAFDSTPKREQGSIRTTGGPRQDGFYTTTGDAQQLEDPFGGGATGGSTAFADDYDPFAPSNDQHNPFDAKASFDGGGKPPALGGFSKPQDDPFGPTEPRKSMDVGADGSRRRKSLANQLSSSTKIEVVATNPHDTSRPGSASTADREAVDKGMEALFLPNIKREQYIPVRVARDKIKHVLAEMAQMKTMHLAAIETMEKQHGILKSQLENACAAYCRKLTGDYNHRLTALEGEYKKRLTQAGHLAPESQLIPLRNQIHSLEQTLHAREEDIASMQSEIARLAQKAQSPTPSQGAQTAALEQRIYELEQELQHRSVPDAQEMEALREENQQLRQYCKQMEAASQQQHQPEYREEQGGQQADPDDGAPEAVDRQGQDGRDYDW